MQYIFLHNYSRLRNVQNIPPPLRNAWNSLVIVATYLQQCSYKPRKAFRKTIGLCGRNHAEFVNNHVNQGIQFAVSRPLGPLESAPGFYTTPAGAIRRVSCGEMAAQHSGLWWVPWCFQAEIKWLLNCPKGDWTKLTRYLTKNTGLKIRRLSKTDTSRSSLWNHYNFGVAHFFMWSGFGWARSTPPPNK